ncbi:hypothetical protein CJF32_00001570 [Rutstroemia sp. NJR-2017a WRK4]|nr:hypothetical protein CJF32_00001570 [Rutstroemia sp. NJR-2017a WRK4]
MDIVVRYATQAPDQRPWTEIKPTLIVSWWCTIFSLVVILFRICGRYVRTEKIYLEDGIILLAIIPLLTRMGFVHVVLLYGTNNISTIGLTAKDIHRREIGSQLVLVSRIFYAAYLWAVKYSISIFLRSLTGQIWQRFHHKLLRYLHILLAVTFLATVISDLAQCHPFTHYWQVTPDPGPQCRQGYAHLFTFGILNIVTNLALILFPVPLILKSRLPTSRKLSVILRLALPFLDIILTIYQLPQVTSHHGDQRLRSLIASFDILLTTFTSNSSVIGSLLQDKGYKKSKYKNPIIGTSPSPYTLSKAPPSRNRKLDSDEDLMIKEDRKSGVVIALEVMRKSEDDGSSVGEGREREIGVKKPEEAWMGDQIRVETAWEIAVTHEDEESNRGNNRRNSNRVKF